MENPTEQVLYEISEELIRQALATQWMMPDILRVSEVKKTTVGRMVFRVETSEKSHTLKIYAPSRKKEIVEKDINLLRFLECSGFPACTLRDAANGQGYGTINGSYAYVYDWIEGKNPEPTVETFEKLGYMTGRLHTVSEPYSRTSDFMPANEIQALLEKARKNGIDQKYIDLLSSIRDFSHLPQGLIHTDIGPHNSLERPNGELVIIDWEDAGLGPMIIDIGWELEQCLSNECVFDTEKAKAFLRGYQVHRMLTAGERSYACDAALFFAFLYWVDEQKDMGTKRIDWLANNRKEFEGIFE
ncbi:phosphotransferase [Patescibacteria group bacterium]|nr:phosphotransferase [Patescibacteria group bacterium]